MGRGRGSSGRPGCSVGRAAGCHRRVRRRWLNEQVASRARASEDTRGRHCRPPLRRGGRAHPRPAARSPTQPHAMCPNCERAPKGLSAKGNCCYRLFARRKLAALSFEQSSLTASPLTLRSYCIFIFHKVQVSCKSALFSTITF